MANMRDALGDTAKSALDSMIERENFSPVSSSIETGNEAGELTLAAAMIVAVGPEAQRLLDLYEVVWGVDESTEAMRVGERGGLVKLVKDDPDAS